MAAAAAGLNPFRLFDDDYRRFLDLVASEIGAGIAKKLNYGEQRTWVGATLDRLHA